MGGFFSEPWWPLGDWRWGVGAVVSMLCAYGVHLHYRHQQLKRERVSGFTHGEFPPEPNENTKERRTILLIALGAAALIGGLALLKTFVPPSSPTWTHQTLSVAEQQQAKAKCRMRASEVYRNRLRNWTAHAQYEADCLTVKGFKLERGDG